MVRAYGCRRWGASHVSQSYSNLYVYLTIYHEIYKKENNGGFAKHLALGG